MASIEILIFDHQSMKGTSLTLTYPRFYKTFESLPTHMEQQQKKKRCLFWFQFAVLPYVSPFQSFSKKMAKDVSVFTTAERATSDQQCFVSLGLIMSAFQIFSRSR